MLISESVQGTQSRRPLEVEKTDTTVFGRRNIRKEEVSNDDEAQSVWVYDECKLSLGEFNQVIAGVLPSGVSEWNSFLRWFERGTILDYADRLISEAQTHVAMDDNASAWSDYIQNMYEYKNSVKATQSQESFPQSVVYPDLPTQP